MFDDSYMDQKNLSNLLLSKSTTPLSINLGYNYPQSHHGVLNNFRDNFEDFSNFQDNSLDLSSNYNLKTQANLEDKVFLSNSKFDLIGDKSYDNNNSQSN
jgi:hypothetical protein